ncbi:permease prefix domain 1-containing protein [Ectobacillus panaciterrae]|uniref:permease prefix domain 1-containing protein n=1 Tax=Ectobacillus panaciterrae TaxID=363872 RepID=UPI0003FD29E5|nr:permease prefix domain 1-containing protein [Ectobacillus panaciterrae]
MKRIDEFVNKMYAHVEGDKKEIQELKEEMRSHLLEAIEELQAEGKSKQKAISIALERFGDEKQLTKGLFGLFTARKQMFKPLLHFSLVCFVICLLSWMGLTWRDHKIADESKRTNQAVHRMMVQSLHEDNLSSSKKEEIISTVKKLANDKKVSLSLYQKPQDSPEKLNSEDLSQALAKKENVITYGDNQTHKYGGGFVYENKHWYAEFGYEENPHFKDFYFIPYGLFSLFGVLIMTYLFLTYSSRKKKVYLY